MRRLKKLLILIFIFNSICLSSYTIKETLKEMKFLKKEISKNEKVVEVKINEIKKSNPSLADQDPFESSTEYKERLKKGQTIIDNIQKQYLDDLWFELNVLRNRMFVTDKIKLKFGEYNPNTEIFTMKIKHLKYQKEEYEFDIELTGQKAKLLFQNKDNIKKTGTLTFFIFGQIVLTKIQIIEPISGFNFKHTFPATLSLQNNDYYYKQFTTASFSSNGEYLAIGSLPNKVALYDLENGKNIVSYSFGNIGGLVTFSTDNNFLIFETQNQSSISICNIETEKTRADIVKENNSIYSLAGQFICYIDGIRKTTTDGKYTLEVDGQVLNVYRNSVSLESEIITKKNILYPPSISSSVIFNEPSKNQYLDALEKGEIKLILTNSGKGPAKGISIKLEPKFIDGLNFNNSYVEEIPTGETATVLIPIEAYIDVKDNTHILRINFDEINGFPPAPVEIQISTKSYEKPEMFIADVGIQDGNNDGKIESGEMIELTLRFANKSKGEALGAYAKFYTGENVFITDTYPKTVQLGDLEYSGFVDINLEFFVNDRTVEEIPLFVDITESTGIATIDKLRIPIMKSDKTHEIKRTVIAGINKKYVDLEFGDDLSIDIEENIPYVLKKNDNILAVVFGIEDYKNISDVSFAHRDARFMKEYFSKALGVKENNIYYKANEDVTKAEFDKVFSKDGWLDRRVKEGKKEIYFYYAGHGAPDIKENKAYLIPYDGDPNYASQTGYEIEEIYDNLANLNAKSVTVFLDACFTGANRESEMLLANARPLMIEVESPIAKGITVFSATGQKEISSAWPEKKHGLFSYYLMKGMQGEADMNNDKKLTIKELGDYINEKVSEQAGYLDREQTPQMISNDENRILINY